VLLPSAGARFSSPIRAASIGRFSHIFLKQKESDAQRLLSRKTASAWGYHRNAVTFAAYS